MDARHKLEILKETYPTFLMEMREIRIAKSEINLNDRRPLIFRRIV